MSSLKTRIVWSYLLLVVLIVLALGGLFITLIWNYYYGSVSSALKQRSESALDLHGSKLDYMVQTEKANYMLQNMKEGMMRLQLLQSDGRMIIDSFGFADDQILSTPDVKEAMEGNTGSWRGTDPITGQRIAAVTVPIANGERIESLIRYTASLEQVDAMVHRLLRLTLLTALVVILMFLLLSLWLANLIVKPLRELTRTARHMAAGDWTKRVATRRRDEIGQLSETLNTLAVELTKREQLKNDFISSISHELRTPLTSIKGWSETIADSESDREEIETGLSIISRETERLTGLVEDLLDFSKLASPGMELHTMELDVNLPVKESFGQLAVRQEETGVSLTCQLARAPIIVEGDANRIKQVLINLIDNAFKFTPRGGSIRVDTSVEDGEAVVTVTDTGSGIAPEDLSQVTDKFYKGRSGQSGSGLGLAICKEIAELHGGRLLFESEAGSGTTVTFRLPLKQSPEMLKQSPER
ncbi:sensor histidine kinase [Paenibacillus beijingensis]|uniref:histidine kinase n=1 Tax=Paenibacillus beijingensis TaxID=1126833 RepID=A0A0D5NG26_9BACL|nr:HAMP domain-containing sensor histidine kinase [Paenibacillus beijingensis]AJY74334.1 hypothetical protein VN24_06780 [Paenibacillus beijingensis]